MALVSRVTVQHSTCYDFFASLLRIASNADYTPANSPNQEIRDWAEHTLTEFPPEMRELLRTFFNPEASYAMTVSGYAAHWDTPDVRTFLTRLTQVPAQDMIRRFLHVGIGPGKDISDQLLKRLLEDDKEAVRFITEHLSLAPQEKWQTLQFLLDPEGMKRDLLKLLGWYFDQIYAKMEDRIERFLQGPEQELNEKLRKYGDEYLRLLLPILPIDYSKRPDVTITLAISYHLEQSSSINMLDDVYFYGYRYFESIENKHVVLAGTQLFKTLADETRLNIVRLLVERPWYGHEIAQKLGISNSTVSHHVTMLVLQGLARTYREDNRVYFTIDPEEFRKVIGSIVDNILAES